MNIRTAFPALRERNFRLYFYAQLISLAGTYLQSTAQGWLVFQLTGSAFWVGLVAALVFSPTFVLVLFGGALVDRLDRRGILYFTQTAAMALAFVLGILTLTHHINLLELNILALCLGIVNALDTPARSAFIPEMIADRANLASAISLNSGMATAAMAVGPAIAGILIALIGVGWTFIINGLTFIAVLFALYAMNVQLRVIEEKAKEHPIAMVKTGLQYLFSNPSLVFLTIVSGIMAIFGRAYNAILPVIAVEVYKGGSETLGYLLSAFGAGAAVGAILLSMFSKKISSKIWIVGGNLLVGASLILFSFTTSLPWGFAFVFLAGLAFVVELSVVITIIQHVVPDAVRGRALSVFYFVYFGGYSLGSFAIGWAAEKIGSSAAVGVSGVAALIIGISLFFFKKKIVELA
jgi:MFS family permease